jgi:hypothetical protein
LRLRAGASKGARDRSGDRFDQFAAARLGDGRETADMFFQKTALVIGNSFAQSLGLLDRPFDSNALIAKACRDTGLDDFGEPDIGEPLRRFLAACGAEARLSLVGRIATNWDTRRFLTNLLRMRAAERAEPGILAQPIERPIFITGLPRSGTTFLHRLMMTDPGTRAPLVWETIYPQPDAAALAGGRDRRIRRVGAQLRAFERLAPEFRALHPLDATSPQECSEIGAHVFRSLRFDTNYRIPSYRHWLDADVERHLPAYRFHKRFLQHLQAQDGGPPGGGAGRWVLKCPEHVFAIRAIRDVYPDARLVFVHRDPLKVLLSVAKLTEVLRRPFARQLDPVEIGRDESARWLDGTRRMMAIGHDAELPEPICHVHHAELIRDPVGTVGRVYRHFSLDFPDQVATAVAEYVAARPNGGYGPRAYRYADHGLDEAAEREKFRPYVVRFGIAAEPAPSERAASRLVTA